MAFFLNDVGMVSAIGNAKTEMFRRLLAGDRSGLRETRRFSPLKKVILCN